MPKYARKGAFIVNCAITPMVSLEEWPYEKGSGLGGSAANAILNGKDPFVSESELGVGWQDPAVINETGLCVWRSGEKPVLEAKINPDFLNGKMALYWTGKSHDNKDNLDRPRNYRWIHEAGNTAYSGALNKNIETLSYAMNHSYFAQLEEGMERLPDFGQTAKKYLGGGHGGYALYLFSGDRPNNLIPIEPYIK